MSRIFVLLAVLGGAPIGDPVSDLSFVDARYAARSLSELYPARAVVLFFTTAGCPVAERTLPVLAEIEKRFRDAGLRVAAVNVGRDDTIVEMAAQGHEAGAEFPFLRDFDGAAARALSVTLSGQAVLLDGERRLVYRGRVASRFRLGGVSPGASREDLALAIEDVLAGRPVAVPETAAEGCPIERESDRPPDKSVTYARDVAPILARLCVGCHAAGGDGPFPLDTYDLAVKRARAIASAVREGRMPPWFASPRHRGDFVNERVLDEAERRTIRDWVAIGTPLGDAGLAPPPRAEEPAPGGFAIGEPDLVLTLAEEETIPAAGDLDYRYRLFPHVFPDDTWISKIEIKPENRRVVHHANLGWVSLKERFDVNENFVTGYVPGGRPTVLEPGTAFRIPKGATLGLEIHYVPTGREETDRISVGLVFPREEIARRIRHLAITTTRFEIPPGAPAHRVTAAETLSADAVGVGLFAHMHWRGKDFVIRAHPPGGGPPETLLAIPNYSFDWQMPYVWPKGARRFPKGTRLECDARFDNSPFNPFNPDPARAVHFGLQTRDEMMYGFFFYTKEGESLSLRVDPATGRAARR